MQCSRKPRILIVEDHPDFRGELAAALAAHPSIGEVDCCNDLPEGIARLASSRPDVLLVDLGLTSGSGLTLIRKAQICHGAACTTAVLTVTGKESDLMKAFAYGAKGYLFKSDTPQDWCLAVTMLAQGQSPLHTHMAQAMLQTLASSAEPLALGCVPSHPLLPSCVALMEHVAGGYQLPEAAQRLGMPLAKAGQLLRSVYDHFHVPMCVLSQRELELLEQLAQGQSLKEVAQHMHCELSSVKTLSLRAYRKLKVNNLQKAIHAARQMGYLA